MKRGPSNLRSLGFARAAGLLKGNNPLESFCEARAAARRADRLSIVVNKSAAERAAPKIAGHDGEPPEYRTPRNRAEWEKKKEPIPEFNANTDRLEWLLAHKIIDTCQHAAGDKLLKDWELSQIGGYASPGGGVGGGSKTAPADAKCDAIDRYNHAIKAVLTTRCSDGHPLSYRGEEVLYRIVLQRWTVRRLAKHWRCDYPKVTALLIEALDALVVHYKLG